MNVENKYKASYWVLFSILFIGAIGFLIENGNFFFLTYTPKLLITSIVFNLSILFMIYVIVATLTHVLWSCLVMARGLGILLSFPIIFIYRSFFPYTEEQRYPHGKLPIILKKQVLQDMPKKDTNYMHPEMRKHLGLN